MPDASPTRTIHDAVPGTFLRVASLPGSRTAARQALVRATRAGTLINVARGVYYKGEPTRYGSTRPAEADIVAALLGDRGVGPSGHSAARAWGVTTQVPSVTRLAAIKNSAALHGFEVESRANLRRATLSPLEVALLELMREPSYIEAGWEALVTTVCEASRNGRIQLTNMSTAVEGEYNSAARANFARLCRDLESKEARVT